MHYLSMLLLVMLLPATATATTERDAGNDDGQKSYDIENARRINRSCALCHGLYGQGTPGALSPRLSGLAAGYLAKELKYYRDGTREYAPMTLASGISEMSDKDIEDISNYLADIDLEAMNLPEIPLYPGRDEQGREIYLDECKGCHRKTGRGKPNKGIPMLAGQYGVYLYNQLRKFQNRERYHDDDPDDDLFDEYDDDTLKALVASLTKLTQVQALARQLAAKDKPAVSGMEGMIAMVGMDSMLSTICKNCSTPRSNYAGRFKITPSGEIILSPRHKDLRKLAGVTGQFRVSPAGALEFIPDNHGSGSTKGNEQ